MKLDIESYPKHITTSIVELFEICYPDTKIPKELQPTTIKKIVLKTIKDNNSFLSNFHTVIRINCSISTYMNLKNILSRHGYDYFYNMHVDLDNLTYSLPSTSNDKDKSLFSSFIKNIDPLIQHLKERNNSENILPYLPFCTNVSFMLNVSFMDIYKMMTKINKISTCQCEYDQLAKGIFDLVSTKNPDIFFTTAVDLLKTC